VLFFLQAAVWVAVRVAVWVAVRVVERAAVWVVVWVVVWLTRRFFAKNVHFWKKSGKYLVFLPCLGNILSFDRI
jgi:hypothetical protein